MRIGIDLKSDKGLLKMILGLNDTYLSNIAEKQEKNFKKATWV